MKKLSREFLEELVKLLLPTIPKTYRSFFLKKARARAGGRRRKKKEGLSQAEKLILELLEGKVGSQAHDFLHSIYPRLDDEGKALVKRLHQKIDEQLEREKELDKRLSELKKLVQRLPRVINWIPGFVTVTGGVLYARGRKPRDFDIIVKMQGSDLKPEVAVDPALWLKLERVFEDVFGRKPEPGEIEFKAEADKNYYVLRVASKELLERLRELFSKETDLPVQVTVSPFGSNWPNVEIYDLVLLRRDDLTPTQIHEPGFERLRKQREEVDPELLKEAERSQKEDKIRPLRFFTPMKPFRGAEPGQYATVELFLDFVEPHLPGYLSKKYDGVSLVFMKSGRRVKIVTEDGLDVTDELKHLANAVRKWKPRSVTFIGEVELWKEGQHYPREAANAAIIAQEDLEHLVVNIHDVILFNDKDLHRTPFEERMKIQQQLPADESTWNVPKPKTVFNNVPRIFVRTRAELEKAMKKLSNVPGSEGVVFDKQNAIYNLTGRPLAGGRFKWHKSVTANAIVLERRKTKTPGIYVYVYGMTFDVEGYKPDPAKVRKLDEKEYLVIGRTFGRKLYFEPGDIVVIEAESVNKITDEEEKTCKVTFWAPNLIEKSKEKKPDPVTKVLKAADDKRILVEKVIEKGKARFLPVRKSEELELPLRMWERIEGYNPRVLRDLVLQDDWRLVAAHYANMLRGKKTAFESEEQLVSFAAKILEELYRRGKVTYKPPDRKPPHMKETTLKLMQKCLPRFVKDGIYFVERHGRLLHEGRKTIILKKRKFDLTKPRWLVFQNKAWGVLRCFKPKKMSLEEIEKLKDRHFVTEEERKEWWPRARSLWVYEVRDYIPAAKPFKVRVPRGVQTFVREVIKEADPYLVYPPKDKPMPYIVQFHFRGKSAHVDFRIAKTKDWGIGYTLLVAMKRKILKPVLTMRDAIREIERDIWKIDWKKGKVKMRRIRDDHIRPAEIRVILKKVKIAKEWWTAHGVTALPDPFEKPIPPGATRRYPGVFYIYDKGMAVAGALKPYFHEYFLYRGKTLTGRILFRAIGRVEKQVLPPGVIPERVIRPYYWVMIQPLDQTPYVLSERAVEKEWLPPRGIAALPPEVKRAIPKRYRYWEHPRKKALALRKELVEEWDIRELVKPIVERTRKES